MSVMPTLYPFIICAELRLLNADFRMEICKITEILAKLDFLFVLMDAIMYYGMEKGAKMPCFIYLKDLTDDVCCMLYVVCVVCCMCTVNFGS